MLHDGLYEQVINKGLDSELAGTGKLSPASPIDTAEASKRRQRLHNPDAR